MRECEDARVRRALATAKPSGVAGWVQGAKVREGEDAKNEDAGLDVK